MTMAGEEEGTREVRFEHCEHFFFFWDPFRCAPPRTLFSSISQSRRVTMVEPLGFSFLGNMTRYWQHALCKFNFIRFHHWYVSWRNITKVHIFLTTRIFSQDTLDIKLPQGYALVFQQKGMLHAGLGNLKHMSDIKWLLTKQLYQQMLLDQLMPANILPRLFSTIIFSISPFKYFPLWMEFLNF